MVFQLENQRFREALRTAEPGVLNGKAVANALLEQLAEIGDQLHQKGIYPRLAVIQVGDDEASSVYIKHKVRACGCAGVTGEHIHLKSVTRESLHGLLKELNETPEIHGILLQLPLPEGIDGAQALLAITPEKDVDGFHPVNLGGLMAGTSLLEPCTPRGIMRLLTAAGCDLEGKRAVVIGRSVIVGRPMALMLARANATVTLCHRHTRNLAEEVARADILVVATGVAGLVKGEWIKPDAVVIDVGISRVGGKLVGDVEFEAARHRAKLITPVPGGVGPMTVATLMENTLRAACIQNNLVVHDGVLVSAREASLSYERFDSLTFTRISSM